MTIAPLTVSGMVLALSGLLVGSFVGAAAVRMPRGEGVVFGRSRCDSCGRRLGPLDLLPTVSFVCLKGRCRYCRAKIDWIQPIAELGGALVGFAAALAASTWPQAALTAILGWQVLLIALVDLRHYWVPKTLIVLLASTAAAIVPVHAVQFGLESLTTLIPSQLAGGALGFLLLAAPALAYRALRNREGLGAADPPLLAALGLWLGPAGVCMTLLLACVAGIATAVALHVTRRSITGQSALPLGAFLALAAFVLHVCGASP